MPPHAHAHHTHHRPPLRRPPSSHPFTPRNPHPAILTPSSTSFLSTHPPHPPLSLLRHLSTLLSTYTSTSADLHTLQIENQTLGSRHSHPSQPPPGLRTAITVLEGLLYRVRVRYEEAVQENRVLRGRAGMGMGAGRRSGGRDWGRGVGVGERDRMGGRGHGHGHGHGSGRRGAVFFHDEFDSEGEDEDEWFDGFV